MAALTRIPIPIHWVSFVPPSGNVAEDLAYADALAERLAFLVDYYYGLDSNKAAWMVNDPQMSAH